MLDRNALHDIAGPEDVAALGLTASPLSDAAVALLGFQRTKQVSAPARKAWMAGDRAPLLAEAAARRDAIFNGALLEIFQEHLPLRNYLNEKGFRPRSVVDIGCGQALPDLFIQRDYAPTFTLIDIEQTDDQYHAWATQGSGYASLDMARALLEGNGVAPDAITTINPRLSPGAMDGLTADLVTSFYSCGFHYPVDEYVDLMRDRVESGGMVCLDLRARYLRNAPPGLARLQHACHMDVIYHDARSYRVVFRSKI